MSNGGSLWVSRGFSGAPEKAHPTAQARISAAARARAMTVFGYRAMSVIRSFTRRLPPDMVVAVWSRGVRPAAIMPTSVRP